MVSICLPGNLVLAHLSLHNFEQSLLLFACVSIYRRGTPSYCLWREGQHWFSRFFWLDYRPDHFYHQVFAGEAILRLLRFAKRWTQTPLCVPSNFVVSVQYLFWRVCFCSCLSNECSNMLGFKDCFVWCSMVFVVFIGGAGLFPWVLCPS